MDFNELIDDFAKRHNVEDLTVTDNAAALDIDGITVLLVSNGELLTISAELGEPPVEGTAVFTNLLLVVHGTENGRKIPLLHTHSNLN